MFRNVTKNGLLSNCSNLRATFANWSRYIPTEPLSHHYSPVVTEEAPIGRYGRIENVGQPSEINNGGTSLAPADGGSGSDLSGGRPPGLTYQAFTLEPQADFVQKLSNIREVEGDCQAYTMETVPNMYETFFKHDMASLERLLERQQRQQDRTLTSEIESSLQRAKDELVKGLLLNQGGELLLDREIGTALEQHLGESPFSEVDEQMDALETQSLHNTHIFYEVGGAIEEAVGPSLISSNGVYGKAVAPEARGLVDESGFPQVPHNGYFFQLEAPREAAKRPYHSRVHILEGPPYGGYGGGSGGGFGGGGSPHYVLIIILCGGGLLLLRVVLVLVYKVYDFCAQWLYAKAEEAFRAMMKDYFKKREEQAPTAVLLRSGLPVLLSGSTLFVMSYLFTPERVREIFRRLLAVMEVLAYQLGRAILEALPHQLREAALRLGHVVAVVGAQIRWLVENGVLPALLFCRIAGLVLCSAYLLFSGACELYKLLEPQQVFGSPGFSQKVTPTGFSLDPREAVLLFCIGLLKSATWLLLGVGIRPLRGLPKQSPNGGPLRAPLKVLAVVVPLAFALAPPHYFQRIATLLLSSPEFTKVVSCVAGRWCCIILVGYMANNEATLRRSLPLFVGAAYFFRVYELAMTATPNLLPS